MSAESAVASRLHIDFCLDVVCPWCWIGVRNLRTAMREMQCRQPALTPQVVWHAAPLLPQTPDQGVDFQAFYLARLGSAQAAAARRAQVNAVAKSVGLQIDFDAIDTFPNSRLACALINSAQTSLTTERMFELVESLYAAFFVHNLNIGQPDVLKPLALAAGLPWAPERLAVQPHGGHPPAGGVPHVEFNGQQALTGAVPAADLLQAMVRATAVAPRQTAH